MHLVKMFNMPSRCLGTMGAHCCQIARQILMGDIACWNDLEKGYNIDFHHLSENRAKM